ncbi:MAG TPA: multicopper oxidase family protein [Pseudonocardiaceae bacterium]
MSSSNPFTSPVSRRWFLAGTGAVAAMGALTACGSQSGSAVNSPTGSSARDYTLTPKVARIDLGGPTVQTWTYGDGLPGPLLRGKVGEVLRVSVKNQLPTDTTVHWHGLAVPNAMDGVPDVTQPTIAAGKSFDYQFALPQPGTYWYHSHVGVQIDRGLYGPLIIDDPRESGDYDVEWIVLLDDWIDGTGTTPDQVLAELKAGRMPGMPDMANMPGMMGPGSAVLGGDGGDVSYPHYLLNGKVPTAPVTFSAKPGQRARIRIINAGGDTAFRVALGGHRLTVTHTDGYAVQPVEVDTLLIAMGERYDVEVTLGDGVFPLVAVAEGKSGQALGVVRTGSGAVPAATATPAELSRQLLSYSDLRATGGAVLAERTPDVTYDLVLGGQMMPYQWTINGSTDYPALKVRKGQYVRLRYRNTTTMYHPMHTHGHTAALRQTGQPTGTSGPRKDTVIVLPGQTVVADLEANNPGEWMLHCHNAYHAVSGLMTMLSYQS